MFAVLAIMPKEAGILKRIQTRLRPQTPQLIRTAVPAGAPFFTLLLPRDKPINWQLVRRTLGSASRSVLPVEGITVPPESGCGLLAADKLRGKLLYNTAVALLQANRKHAQGMALTVLDSAGRFAPELRAVVPLARTVRVVTQQPGLYRAACREALQHFGASILLTAQPDAAQNSTVVLALDAACTAHFPKALVVALPGTATGRHTLTGQGVPLGGAWRELLPPGVAPELFACALYEHCGVAQLGGGIYADLQLEGKKTSLRQLQNQLPVLLREA